MPHRDTESVIRASFKAYVTRDRDLIESVIAEDFHFSSPYDDRIGRAPYFERCWANADKIKDIRIERLFAQGDEAFSLYQVTTTEGAIFHNTEFYRVRDGRLVEVQVFFGEMQGQTPKQ